MITNRVGPPVRGEDFFGREAFVELVSEKLQGGNVLLAAPRRFGKTSVMYSLIDQPRWNYKVIHADLEHLTTPAELITVLVEQLVRSEDEQLSRVARRLSYFPGKFWSRFTKNFQEVELLKIKIKLRDELRPRWQEAGEELFKKIADLQTTIIFILDELPMMIDRMARSEAHREDAKTMLRWLRSLRISPDVKNVRFLIAGSIGISRVLNELGEISAIGDFEQMRLDPFSPKLASAFLDKLSDAYKAPLSKPSKKRMLELVGTPIPYFIQIIFSEVAKAHAQDGEPITPKKIERIYREKVLGVDCKTYFDHYYGRLRDYCQPHEEKAAKRILREIAMTGALARDACSQFYKREVGDRKNVEEFNRLMTDLENDFYIRFDTDTNQFEFACKLLRDWWLRHYGMEADI